MVKFDNFLFHLEKYFAHVCTATITTRAKTKLLLPLSVSREQKFGWFFHILANFRPKFFASGNFSKVRF